jgi:hypothetical protein
MKKSIVAAAFAASLATAAFAAPAASAATTLPVCNAGCTYSSLQSAVDAAQPGDTIQVQGDLTVAGTTRVDEDVTIAGTAGATVTQTADAITFLMAASGSSLSGLTVTSDKPYPKEFVQIGADGVTVEGSTIYGPAQAGPMSGWVGNRGVVTQGGVTGLSVTGNTFHSLRSGAYLNPDGSGTIAGNTVYNTKGDFLIHNANFTFEDNRRGPAAQPSEWGFVVFAATAPERYPSMAALSAANNNMTAWDQRDGEKVVTPQTAGNCRNDGWWTYTTPAFDNQGQCIKFVTVPAGR